MNCPFCEEFKFPGSFKKVVPQWPFEDRIICRNDLAIAFPGLGPIVPQTPYVLITPKSCSYSFLDTPTEEREAVFDLLDKILQNENMFPCNQSLVFEHGGTNGNSGCKCIYSFINTSELV